VSVLLSGLAVGVAVAVAVNARARWRAAHSAGPRTRFSASWRMRDGRGWQGRWHQSTVVLAEEALVWRPYGIRVGPSRAVTSVELTSMREVRAAERLFLDTRCVVLAGTFDGEAVEIASFPAVLRDLITDPRVSCAPDVERALSAVA
jgi:hypothetical protein